MGRRKVTETTSLFGGFTVIVYKIITDDFHIFAMTFSGKQVNVHRNSLDIANCDGINRQPQAVDSPVDENKLLIEIRQPLAGDLDWNDFLQVPFSHHIEILGRCKSTDERILYIHQCATRGKAMR